LSRLSRLSRSEKKIKRQCFREEKTRRRYNEIHFTPIHPNFRQVKDKVQLKVLKKQIVWESLMTCCKERVTPKVQKRGLQHFPLRSDTTINTFVPIVN